MSVPRCFVELFIDTVTPSRKSSEKEIVRLERVICNYEGDVARLKQQIKDWAEKEKHMKSVRLFINYKHFICFWNTIIDILVASIDERFCV